MTKTPTRLIAAACAVLALASAGQAFAHRGPDDGHQRTPPTAAQVGEHLSRLKADLKISAAQEGAWKQFEDTVRSQSAAREKLHAEMAERRKAGTPPDAQQRETMRQQFEASRAARDKARDTLYAALTPEQKTLADQRLHHGRHEGHGMRHGHHGPHGGPQGGPQGGPGPNAGQPRSPS